MLVLLAALGIGATAGLLPNFQVLSTPSTEHGGYVPAYVAFLAAFGFGAVVLTLVYRALKNRRGERALQVRGGLLLAMFVGTFLIVAVLLAVAFALVHPHDILSGASGGSLTNTTNSSSGTSSPGNGQGNATAPGSSAHAPDLQVTPLILGVTVGVLGAVVAVPLVGYALLRRRRRSETEPYLLPPDLPDRLEREVQAIDPARTGDARAQIVRVYARLLHELKETPMGDLQFLTPREIESRCRSVLGLSAGGAGALRELFEEARYSPHEMTPAQAGHAREQLGILVEDLRRVVQRQAPVEPRPEEVRA